MLLVSPTGVASAEAVGAPAIGFVLTVTPDGVQSAEAVGVVTIGGQLTVFPLGIASEEVLGSPSVLDFATQPGAYLPLAGLLAGSGGALVLGSRGEILHTSSGDTDMGSSASIESP
jgi:hypothetical protein